MKTYISFYEALEIIQNFDIPKIGTEKIFFGNALNRVLSEDIIAKQPMPRFYTSSMDGYAFCYDDLEVLQSEGLKINGDNPAGLKDFLVLEPKTCIKTFTGSRMPKNSDSIVIIENIDERNGRIFLKNPQISIQKGDWVRKIGENYQQGEVLLKKGQKISAYEIGLLADLNKVFIEVFRKPKIGILSGGNEIIEVGESSENENIVRSVNNHLLKALVESLGGEGVLYPMMSDDKTEIKRMFENAFKDCDMLLSTGGMSKGDYDFTQEVMQDLCKMEFKGVRIKPGKPVAFGKYKDKFLLALPGNPNSAAITFYLFGYILFYKMLGVSYKHIFLKAVLEEKIIKKDSRMEFRVCDLHIKEGEYYVGFSDKKVLQSSVVNNLCQKSALCILPEGEIELKRNDKIEILLFKEFI